MSAVAIRVEGLSKQYKIGGPAEPYGSLRESLARAVTNPFRRLRRPSAGAEDNTLWALRDVSFEVKHGEVVGIIGRNGAGKSTLLKVLSRITEPTKGRIDLYGRVGSLLEVGTGFHPELTGRENIMLNGTILGMSRNDIKARFDEIVAFAEVERFIDTPVKRYSSGMYLRLAFAVAAHLEPDILVVDEVLAVGDAQFQKKCMGKMGDVAREGRTVLFVSHNMAAVHRLCSSALLLESGQTQALGQTDLIIGEYMARITSDVAAVVTLPPAPVEALGAATCLRFYAEDGTPRAYFDLNEPWYIVLEFKLYRSLPQVIAAVGLVAFDGTPIITWWSRSTNLTSGKYRVKYTCKLPLMNGNVQFTVGISTNDFTFHSVIAIGHVSIGEIAHGEQPYRLAGTGMFNSTFRPDIMVV